MLHGVDPNLKSPQAICISPNRVLAIQTRDLVLKIKNHSPIDAELGLPPYKADYEPLVKKPPVRSHVIIGTPVTIHKWIAAQKLAIDHLKMVLIDDVDRVLAE
ncbi:DEAD-box ATP-dependent RNA helicase 38, partial [Tanacetum coccineum]